MNDTPNLALPYILASQAQKHVTHNEAIRALDCLVQLSVESRALTAPPSTPADGDRFLVGASATGDWTGQSDKIAAFQDGAWAFYEPKNGWIAWVADERALLIFAANSWSTFAGGDGGSGGGGDGGGLEAPVSNSDLANMSSGTIKGRTSAGNGHPEDLSGTQVTAFLDAFVGSGASHKKGLVPDPGATAGTSKFLREDGSWAEPPAGGGGDDSGDITELDNLDHVGINATGDTTNRLALKSPASLFDNVGNGHQQKINKHADSDTASVLYQTNYSGRAEIGLTADDDFHFKVSPNGSTWFEGIKIDRTSGRVSFPSGGVREVLTANRTYFVDFANGNDANLGLTSGSGNALKSVQAAWNKILTIDLNGFTATIQLADSTSYGGLGISAIPVGGPVVLQGNASTPANVRMTSSIALDIGANVNLTVRNLQLNGSFNSMRITAGGALVTIDTGVILAGSPSNGHANVQAGKLACNAGSFTIASGSLCWLGVNQGGAFAVSNSTINFSGTPAWSFAGIGVNEGGVCEMFNVTLSGAATGQRYNLTTGGIINSFGAGTASTYFPGNSNGTTGSGGNQV